MPLPSSPAPDRRSRPHIRGSRTAGSRHVLRALTCCLVVCSGASARADGTIDAFARWAVAPKVWKGQTIPAPVPQPRPHGAETAYDSPDLPVRLHVEVSDAHASQHTQTLHALERAYAALAAQSWPLPWLDGERGGSPAIDLYEVSESVCPDACAAVDDTWTLSDCDSAQSYALISHELAGTQREACVYSALAQAGLRAADPSEAASWARASAEFVAWLHTGEGCRESLVLAQAHPELGLLDSDPQSAFAGALWLAFEGERLSRDPGTFVRSLWESTRQRSKPLVPLARLRSSPDLWEVLRATLEAQHRTLDDELIEFGVARYFSGPAERRTHAGYRIFAELPSDAGVPLVLSRDSAQLPLRLRAQTPLRAAGSAYVRVQLSAAAHPAQLQIWLRGELGARWSLTVVRLAADGREVGRTGAPARDVPNSYVPVVLDADTAALLIAITRLPERPLDADRLPETERAYELIITAAATEP